MTSTQTIIIVGAGMIGTSIAARLSARNDPNYKLQIILIDALDPRNPAQYKTLQTKQVPASIFSGGWINSCWKTPVTYNILNHLSYEIWPAFLHSLNITPNDVQFTKKGTICFSDSPQSMNIMHQKVNTAIRSGANYCKIKQDAFNTLLPHLSDMDSNHSNPEFYYNKDEGAVNPLLVIQQIINQLTKKHNITFIEQKVIGFECKDTHSVDAVILQNGDVVACDIVILAAGRSIPKLVRYIDASVVVPMVESRSLVVRCKTSKVKTNVSVLKKFSGAYNYTLIPRTDCLQMTGGYAYNPKVMNHPQQFKHDVCSQWLPHLRKYDIKETDCKVMGPFYRTMPLDRRPIIGFIYEDSNAYIATMHSGVTLAPLMSSLIANEIMLWLNHQKIDEGVLDSFRLNRFQKESKL